MKIAATIALLAVTLACSPGGNPDGQEQAGASDALPSASFLLAQRAADYEAWKTAFDADVQAREDATCLGHYLKRGVDDSEMVYVYCLAKDVERLRTYVEGYDLAEFTGAGGSTAGTSITLMRPMSRDLVSGRLLPGLIAMPVVKDYDAWRVAYDELDEFRRQSGIVGHAVSRGHENPNQVIFYHQADDVGDLRSFVETSEFEALMERSGTPAEPDVHFIQVVGFSSY